MLIKKGKMILVIVLCLLVSSCSLTPQKAGDESYGQRKGETSGSTKPDSAGGSSLLISIASLGFLLALL